jgi:hypothetical protein
MNINPDAADFTTLNVHTFHVTRFTDEVANKKYDKPDSTLPLLRDLVLGSSGPSKDQLCWLKLALFGHEIQG